MSDRVSVTITDGVADVRLNRPDKLNALDPAMFDALIETGEAIKADRSVRAVVLSGEGRGFCAGLDFGSFQAMAGAGHDAQPSPTAGAGPDTQPAPSAGAGPDTQPSPTAGGRQTDPAGGDGAERKLGELGRRDGGRITNRGQQAVYVWTEMPAPVIAAVHGVALGGGIQLALGADIRIVAPDARMSVLEIRWGLVPDMTGTQMLPRLVGLDVAKELTLTGRMVSGEEAVRLGLATRVSERPLDDALALAHEIAAKSPQAVRGAKALLNLAGLVSLKDGFLAESNSIGDLIGSPNQVEAVMAYFEKRSPQFSD